VVLGVRERGDLQQINLNDSLFGETKPTHPTLWHDMIKIRFAKSCTLQQIHDIRLARALLVQAIFILFLPDRAAQDDFLVPGRKSAVRIVERDFNWKWVLDVSSSGK